MTTHTLRSKRRRSALRTAAFMSPWLIGFSVFFVYPMISTVYFSFTQYDGFGAPVFNGLTNWTYVFSDYPMFWPSLRNTLWLVLVMVTCRVVFGLGIGMLITRIKTGTGVFRTLFYLPTWPRRSPRRSRSSSCSIPAPGRSTRSSGTWGCRRRAGSTTPPGPSRRSPCSRCGASGT